MSWSVTLQRSVNADSMLQAVTSLLFVLVFANASNFTGQLRNRAAPRAPREVNATLAHWSVGDVVDNVFQYGPSYVEGMQFSQTTQDDRGVKNFVVGRMRNEFYVHTADPPVNKIILAFISAFGLGVCGVDRCFMGQTTLGLVKGFSCGGCGVWACVDWVVISINCLMFAKSIDSIGYEATWIEGTVTYAFYATLGVWVLKLLAGPLLHRSARKGEEEEKELDQTDAFMQSGPSDARTE